MKTIARFVTDGSLKWAVVSSCCVTFGLSLVGCTDPADDVAKSSVGGAEEAAPPPVAAQQYVIGEESVIEFIGSKVTGSHDGGFTDFTGKFYVVDGVLAESSVVEINMTSTWTDNDRLTAHIKSPDFFDVETFPTSTFTLTRIDSGPMQTTLTGNLALHGVTNSLSFPANVQVDDDAVTVRAEFALNRKEFNINYPGKPDDLIRDSVVIKLNVTATPVR